MVKESGLTRKKYCSLKSLISRSLFSISDLVSLQITSHPSSPTSEGRYRELDPMKIYRWTSMESPANLKTGFQDGASDARFITPASRKSGKWDKSVGTFVGRARRILGEPM